MTDFEAQVLSDLSALKTQVHALIGGGPARATNAPGRARGTARADRATDEGCRRLYERRAHGVSRGVELPEEVRRYPRHDRES